MKRVPCVVRAPGRKSLVDRVEVLPDPHRRREVRHPFAAILLIAACAVTADARTTGHPAP